MFLGRGNKLEAMVGPDSEFRGDITVKGTFRIDGAFHGNISADSVILGEQASVRGNLVVRSVVIGGSVEGNITADELVEIKHTGRLRGDIRTRKLSVAEGGVFDGRSNIHRDESKIIDFPTMDVSSK